MLMLFLLLLFFILLILPLLDLGIWSPTLFPMQDHVSFSVHAIGDLAQGVVPAVGA